MANVDIAPELLEQIKKSFDAYYNDDEEIEYLERMVNKLKATYAEAERYSLKVGECLVRALDDNLSADVLPDGTMYYNIAAKILPPSLKNTESLISKFALKVQERINKDAGYSILVKKAPRNVSRVNGLVEYASSAPYDEVKDTLDESVINYAQSVVTDTMKANGQMQSQLGLNPIVTRIYDDIGLNNRTEPCAWCLARQGTWTYEDAIANGVFERHRGCRCKITYTIGNRSQVQTHWENNTWRDVR